MYRPRDEKLKGLTLVRDRGHGRADYYLRVGGKLEVLRDYTLKQAQDARRDKLTDAGRGLAPVAGGWKFADLLTLVANDAKAKGSRGEGVPSRRLKEYFTGKKLKDLTTAAIKKYEAARQADTVGHGKKLMKPIARSTVNADLAWLRHALNLAVEAGWLAVKPVIKTPVIQNARQGFFELKDFEAVVAQLPEHLKGVALFAYLTGWRTKSEVLPLTWKQVDRKAGIVRLEPGTTKNKEGREFPFAALPQLKQLLNAQLASGAPHSSPWVFHHEGQRLDYKPVRLAWRTACRKAKLPGRLLHDLRRTAVRNLVRAGVPQVIAMSLTGHRTMAVFQRYAIIDTNLQREGVAKLAKSLDPQTTG